MTITSATLQDLPTTRLGELLTSARTGARISRTDHARRLGVPVSRLRTWETGAGRPSPTELTQYVSALGLTVAQVVPQRSAATLPAARPTDRSIR